MTSTQTDRRCFIDVRLRDDGGDLWDSLHLYAAIATANRRRADENGSENTFHATVGDVRQLRELVNKCEAEAVGAMRQNGSTWEAVASALGVSRQAAQKKYGR